MLRAIFTAGRCRRRHVLRRRWTAASRFTALSGLVSWNRRTAMPSAWNCAPKHPVRMREVVTVKYRDGRSGLIDSILSFADRIVVELKAVKILERVHEAQVLSYLKASQTSGRASDEFRRHHSKGGSKARYPRVPVSCFGSSCSFASSWSSRRRVLFVVRFDPLPLRVHLLQRRAVERAAVCVEVGFHLIESLRELLVRFSQRSLGLNPQPP